MKKNFILMLMLCFTTFSALEMKAQTDAFFINDTEVSFALFEMIDNWARFLKADKIIGDISFSELGNIGVLNSGHDKFATFQHRYNYPYYAEHLKEYGYTQSKKLNEYQLILSVDSYKQELMIENKYKFVEGDKEFKIKNSEKAARCFLF